MLHLFWTLCTIVGFIALSCCALLIAVTLWLCTVAPRLEERRRRRQAIDQVLADSQLLYVLAVRPVKRGTAAS
jgi:hypothetical protein